MNLSRKELFDEMGLSPQWALREDPGVARKLGNPAPREAIAPAPGLAATPVSAVSVSAAPAAPVRVSEAGWGALRQSILECRACGLCEARKQAVPGVGDEQADCLFIGEGPGAEEDARGEPFVGQAGKLLDSMLAAIDLDRTENVYIANAVKCRPPGNRTPEPAEMKACWPYLERQIELLNPKVIVLLGKAAVFSVLGEEGTLGSLRGKSLSYRKGDVEIPVVVTYHPAYLLRNLPDKAKAWEDLCRVRQLIRQAPATA